MKFSFTVIKSRFYVRQFFLLLLIFGFFGSPFLVFALTESETSRQARLQGELQLVEKEIAAQTKLLEGKQKETASIQRDVDVLTYKIATAKLNIRSKQLQIERLGTDIVKKEQAIGSLSSKIEDEKISLAELLRKTRELDNSSTIDIALGGQDLSDVFSDLNAFNLIENSLHQSFNLIRSDKKDNEDQKVGLEKQRESTLNAKASIEAESKKIQTMESEKKSLLAVSKTQEGAYKQVLADKKKKQADILSALFTLRDSKAIPFEKALAYANEASNGTGVRPAFILAILTQETNLGANVGTCNRPGDSESKSWKNIMKPTRDIEPYLRIVKTLGLTPESMPLSCPQGNGYGGAMGPSQFIPSTWEIYQNRVAVVTGNSPANPWNPEDAFAATSLFLKDLGADARTYVAESRAAGKYYAGGYWATSGKGYSASVMAIATRIQGNIDYLQSN